MGEQIDRERIRKVVAVVEERGHFTAEDARQLVGAGVRVYSYVDRAALEAGEVKELPPEVRALIEARP